MKLREPGFLDFRHARDCPAGIWGRYGVTKGTVPLGLKKAVRHAEDFPEKNELEHLLQRYLVRVQLESGGGHPNKSKMGKRRDLISKAMLPTLALERMLGEVLDSGGRTHISSRRESLCFLMGGGLEIA